MDQTPTQQPTGNANSPLSNLPGGLSQKKLLYIVVGVVVLGGLGMLVRGMFSRNAGEFMAERAIERATGGNVDVDYRGDNTITYKGKEGSVQVGENASLPSDWPSDVPVISGAKISYSGTSNPATGQSGASVMFTTTKSAAEVAEYYNAELASQGWAIEGTGNFGGTSIVSAKKDSRTVGISIVSAEETTTVTIGVQTN